MWRYAVSGRRDLRLDFIRGYCVFMMVVDHIGGPSWLYFLTGNNRYIVSAAEGFVFISGMVLALVYRPTVERLGFEEICIRAFSRAFQLYLLFVGLTFAMVGLALAIGSPISFPLGNPVEWAIGVVTLRQSAYLTDVLLFYTFAVAAAPLPFLFFRRGHTRAVLLGSGLLWAAYQWRPDLMELPWPIERQDAFPFAAWQLLFVLGMAIGYHEPTLRRVLGRIPTLVAASGLLGALAILLALNRFASRLGQLVGGPLGTYLAEMFYKFDVRPGRVLALLVVFALFYLVLTLFWKPIHAAFGWLFLTLGQHALDAYSLHIFCVLVVGAARVRLGPEDAFSIGPNTVLQLACLLLIWALIRFGAIDWVMGRERAPTRAPAAAGTR
ncbi:MAG: OpgC domain-containing protein [Chloroflexi bacterium]|nr:OpgC domain-containing protein [Chloroflexota bacterium]